MISPKYLPNTSIGFRLENDNVCIIVKRGESEIMLFQSFYTDSKELPIAIKIAVEKV